MKKLIITILTIAMAASFAACGKISEKEEEVNSSETVVETDKTQEDITEEIIDESADEKEETQKEEENKEVNKPANTQKPENKPESKPESKPENKPENKPEEKPSEAPSAQNKTLGKILLEDFKAKASSGMSAEQIAQGLMNNSAIKFGGGVTAVEEGLLSGFDNAEITGFKSGYMIAPMIGSIAFVGYVFEMNSEADVASFVSVLEKNANPRWNICVEAEETVTGSYGNKVFFVMCPTSLDE